MRVFDELDKEQAGMYRWIRANLSEDQFMWLVGSMEKPMHELTNLEVDRELREAYHRYQSHGAVKNIAEASKIRAGLLPKEIGEALANLLEKARSVVIWEMNASSKTMSEVDFDFTVAYERLCNEIAKLRRNV